MSLHPLDRSHLPALTDLNMRFVRIAAGPGWGGMSDPAFPDRAAEMPAFIARHFDRDDPRRLAVFRATFAYFREHDIRTILVLYDLPFHWLKQDYMRTLEDENVDRLVAKWVALLEFFRARNMPVDFVELANEPDGNWNGHIPAQTYYRLVERARRAFDRAGFAPVRLLGPGLSSLDLEHRAERWIAGMPPATARALGGFSLHGWDEVLATDSMPDYLAASWEHPLAAFRKLDARKEIFLTEYATEITRFGRATGGARRDFASPRSGALYTAAESPRYALRVLANTLVHLNHGVSVPVLWRLGDNDSDGTAWGMIRPRRHGSSKRPYYHAIAFLGQRLPIGARVIAARPPVDRERTRSAELAAVLLAAGDRTVWTGANLGDKPRRIRLRLRPSGPAGWTGTREYFALDTTITAPQPVAFAGEAEFVLPAESAVVLQLHRERP